LEYAPRIARNPKTTDARSRVHIPEIRDVDAHDPALGQLDHQIRFYDDNARRSMAVHFRLRGTQLVAAAAIPITQIFGGSLESRVAAGFLGGLIAVCQGWEAMHHYGEHYVAWRATCQQLLRERLLFASEGGEYKGLPAASKEALALLSARVVVIEQQEQVHWQANQLKNSAGPEPAAK
jgi:hypothetical protein